MNPIATGPSKAISVSAAACRLGISDDTCRSWFDAGELDGFRTASGYRKIVLGPCDPAEPHFSISAAAQMMGLGVSTVRQRFDEGRLAGYRSVTNQRRIARSAIERVVRAKS